jgi:GTP-binding protein
MVSAEAENIADEYKVLKNELKKYNPELLYKERILAITKSDLIDAELQKMLIKAFKEEVDEEIDVLFISSVTNKNLDVLKDKLWHLVN